MTLASPAQRGASALVLVRLRTGADSASYERWAAEVDGPTVLSGCDGITDWRLYRLDERGPTAATGAEIDYVEVVTGSDRDAVGAALSSPVVVDLVQQASRYIEAPTLLVATRLV